MAITRHGAGFPRVSTLKSRDLPGKGSLSPLFLLALLLLPLSFSSIVFAASNGSSSQQAKGGVGQSGSGHNNPKMDYALIFGTVWGADDRPVYGVPVKIRRADDKPKKVRWELISDHSGEFAQRVPTGKADYIIWADIKTKKGESKPETRVHIEDNERVDTSLHLPPQ